MTNEVATRDGALAWAPPKNVSDDRVGEIVRSFLDNAATGFGKATHYNKQHEVQAAERSAHLGMLSLDRGLYTAFLTLPGVTDRSRQFGVRNLLTHPRNGKVSIVSPELEREITQTLIGKMPVTRMLRLFEAFRFGDETLGIKKANTNRTRKMVLRTLLRSRKIDWWAVKYRDKMRTALTHAWGERKSGIMRAILSKPPSGRNSKESKILREEILSWAPKANAAKTYECVGFILGAERKTYTIELFQKFEAAKRDIAKGKGLPLEILEGIAAAYHPKVKKAELLALTKHTMTSGQKMAVQRQAKKAGVEVEMDPTRQEAVKLYVYAYEMGMTKEIEKALFEKGREAARGFPFEYDSIGILVDCSTSMEGSQEQKMRPIATALATRDMLQHTTRHGHVKYVGGSVILRDEDVIRPQGETDLATGLVELIKLKPDAIFVISDGYENTPAGRFSDVCAHLKRIGIKVPIFHLNPVVAAEASGVREIAPGLVPTMPMQRPDALGLSFLRGVLDTDPVRAINALLNTTSLAEQSERKALT